MLREVVRSMPVAESLTLISPWSLLAFLLLGGIIVGGIVTVYLLKREEAEETPVTDDELLAEFQRARDTGEMDEEEFRRVTAVLEHKNSGKLALIASPDETHAPEPSHPEPGRSRSQPGGTAEAEPTPGRIDPA